MNCLDCKKYNRYEDKCKIHKEIIAILCCEQYENATPTAKSGCPNRAKRLNKKGVKQNDK